MSGSRPQDGVPDRAMKTAGLAQAVARHVRAALHLAEPVNPHDSISTPSPALQLNTDARPKQPRSWHAPRNRISVITVDNDTV